MNRIKPKEEITIVWFKRDLRLHDHGPLQLWEQISKSEDIPCLGNNVSQKVIGLYVDEEDYWRSEKASQAQRNFVWQSLLELEGKTSDLGGKLLIVRSSNAQEVFSTLLKDFKISSIIAHRETGNRWTFDRDLAVIKLCKDLGIKFLELEQDPLLRGRAGRKVVFQNNNRRNDSFSQRYYDFVSSTQYKIPTLLKSPNIKDLGIDLNLGKMIIDPQNLKRELKEFSPNPPLLWGEFGFENLTDSEFVQKGGEDEAIDALLSFLEVRCLNPQALGGFTMGYRKAMGSPEPARMCCSRVSPHLTWGTLSPRAAYQTAYKALRGLNGQNAKVKHIQSFLTRLAWRSHFMQKFETLHWMEFQCINRKAESLHGWDENAFESWASGNTGYPFVDACMRSLNATQWLNFRARAMVVSFASYALNLDWRGFGPHLARNFLDYEPGIHYSQLQMQGGTTLGSPPRIYSPIKQSLEKDPEGSFIRRWVPELRNEPLSTLHLPSDYSRNGYPPAVVEYKNLWNIMRSNAPQSPKKAPAGSKSLINREKKPKPKPLNPQMELELELELELKLD